MAKGHLAEAMANTPGKWVKAFIARYLIEEDPKAALAHLLAPIIIDTIAKGVWVLGILLLVFWPQEELPTYLFENDIPLNFLIISEVLLLGGAYLHLICGNGEVFPMGMTRYTDLPRKTLEESRPFFTYGLVKFLIHIFLILVPFLPFMLFSAILTQVPWVGIVKGMMVIYSFSLFCRLIGFLAYLNGAHKTIAYFLCRAFILSFLGVTWYFESWINPILMIYHLHQKANELMTTVVNSYTVYLAFITTMIFLLIGIIHLQIQRKLSHEL